MDFIGLFKYSHHCNYSTIELFKQRSEDLPEKAGLLFDHILNAHHIWNHRILDRSIDHLPWDRHSLKDLRDIEDQNYNESINILRNVSIEKLISYTNTKEQDFQNSVGDILFHIVNHSTYHRAQIATELKDAGIPPLVSDYIFYKR
jgi:uncharacterized damage-inducible protein DinB